MSINPDSAATKAKAINSTTETQATESNPYDARDIVAQEMMANASGWMAWAAIFTFAVTTIGTLFLALQVRLTRKALEASIDATCAMRDSNLIAQRAQRPWIAIDIDPIRIVQGDGLFSYEINLVFKNTGSGHAEQFNVFGKLEHQDEDFQDTMSEWHRRCRELVRKEDGYILPPGETDVFSCRGAENAMLMPWSDHPDGSRKVHPIVTALAFYRIEGTNTLLEARRSFFVGERSRDDWAECIIEGTSLRGAQIKTTPFRNALSSEESDQNTH